MTTTNPFIIDKPAPVEELINRSDEWRDLVERAEAGQNSLLSGPRRFGKTTLLRKLGVETDKLGFNFVYVDFFGVLSPDDLLLRIEDGYAESLKGAVGRWFVGVRRKWRTSVRAGTSAAGVQAERDVKVLPALHEALDLPRRVFDQTGMRAVVVFDEFQEILAADNAIDGLIRSKIQHHGDAATYVFAGSHPGLMAELFGSRARPLFGQARPMVLMPLSDESLADYIGMRFARSGKDIGAALDPLLDLVRGHPQRAMLLAHHVWGLLPEGGTADEGTFNRAFETALEELQEAFERAWQEFSTNERRVVSAVAWTGRFGQGASLFEKSTLERFRLSKGTAQYQRDALVKRGEMQVVNGSTVQLVDPLLEAWIASVRRPRGIAGSS